MRIYRLLRSELLLLRNKFDLISNKRTKALFGCGVRIGWSNDGICLKRCIFTTLLPFFSFFYCGIQQTYFSKKACTTTLYIYISHLLFLLRNGILGTCLSVRITVLLYYITHEALFSKRLEVLSYFFWFLFTLSDHRDH
jgi:hypothetical protein